MDRNNKTCLELVDSELRDRADDFIRFMHGDTDCKELKGADSWLEEFNQYGLDFSFVEPETFKNQEIGYYRYQLSWGGPSDEIRFFENGKIEYWYMDWFDGACKTITDKNWAIWLSDMFMIDEQAWGK